MEARLALSTIHNWGEGWLWTHDLPDFTGITDVYHQICMVEEALDSWGNGFCGAGDRNWGSTHAK